VDLGSHNGTFVNGEPISTATVTEADILSIGRATFRLVGDELREYIDEGNVSLVAQDLTVRISGGKVLLDHVSFPIGERNLVAVIGPSGAGKTTLLGALTGMRPATEGAVLYDERDLYTHYAELRHRIGLVPQQDILHSQLSARRALRYAAELRFPGDTSKEERNRRVDEVIDELGLKAHANTRAGSLSGGQQKRVNVALELLTKPSLLFLDEPTSGLDPGLDKSVMEMMSGLAKDGRTVIVVTHSVANLDVCDRLLVLVPGGSRLAGGLQAVVLLPGVRGERADEPGARVDAPRAGAAPGAAEPPGAAVHSLPALPGGHRLGPQLPDRARRAAHPPGGIDQAVRGVGGAGRPQQQIRPADAAGPGHLRLLHRCRQLRAGTGQGASHLQPGTGRRPVGRRLPALPAPGARAHHRCAGSRARCARRRRQATPGPWVIAAGIARAAAGHCRPRHRLHGAGAAGVGDRQYLREDDAGPGAALDGASHPLRRAAGALGGAEPALLADAGPLGLRGDRVHRQSQRDLRPRHRHAQPAVG